MCFAREIHKLEMEQFVPPKFRRYTHPSFKAKTITPRALPHGKVKSIPVCMNCLKQNVVTPFKCACCTGQTVNPKEG